jgi:hypothetical protein
MYESVEKYIRDLEVELMGFERTPLVTLDPRYKCYDDTVAEFAGFNAINWDTVATIDIARLSDPYIAMTSETFYFLLPKFWRAVVREAGKTDMVDTVFEMLLRRLGSEAESKASIELLSPTKVRKIYYLTRKIEDMVRPDEVEFLADTFLENALKTLSRASNTTS